ncbi:MAG: hypothetical protein O3B87_04005 [bacterium]|nr:hypothetical protein [bacterium]
MKVFFTATYEGEQQYGKYYHLLFEEIKKLGYEHVDDEVVSISYDEYIKKMSKGRDAQLNNFHNKMQHIQDTDICILEVSAHSLGLGYIAQRALEMSKPTIVLYYKNNTPFFLQGSEDEKLIVLSYDEKNYKKVLKKALEQAREKRDKRFNFFLSPKLLQYIDDASRERGITKSKLLRDMIVNHMRESDSK